MELPFAVESPDSTERTSQIIHSDNAGNLGNNSNNNNNVDDGSSLVTTSSQGSFLGSSDDEADGFGTINLSSTLVTNPQPSAPQQPIQQNYPRTATTIKERPNPPLPPQSQPQEVHHVSASPIPPQPQQSPSPSHRQQQQQQQPMLPPAPPVPPAAQASVGGITSGLNIFGNLRVPRYLQSTKKSRQPPQSAVAVAATAVETVDFTYVNVCESDADEVDISLDERHSAMDGLQGTLGGEETSEDNGRDILTILLSGVAQAENSDNETLVLQCEEANRAACEALDAKKQGDLQGALEAHALAAKMFRECAVLIKDRNANMANSLLLLSQTQAKSALSLKRIVKQQPANPNDSSSNTNDPRSKIVTQKDRLRAAVRGALVTRNEEDISDSAFLGRATKGPMTDTSPNSSSVVQSSSSAYAPTGTTSSADNANASTSQTSSTEQSQEGNANHNPVDDMMELERELKDMDMALELGNSIASLDARTQSRLKNSIVDGSFMVIPGSESYMSSSNMWSPSPNPSSRHGNTNSRNNNVSIAKQNQASQARAAAVANAGAPNSRKNRVQNILQASVNHPAAASVARAPHHGTQQHAPHIQHQQPQQPASKNAAHAAPSPGLESSWWGSSSTTSHVLASSVISLGASSVLGGIEGDQSVTAGGDASGNQPAANTKQLMRLMDALKTLGDENANLLREVEGAEAARMEAKAAKEQMAKFKAEYGKRFHTLKAALEKFRKGYPENAPDGSEPNPVTHSNFMQSATATEQLQRQEQLIRKLTADLKKEKEESKKKDAALRKYESFYREVKARSAQKAAQRQKDAAGAGRPPQPQQHAGRPGQR